MDRTTRTNAERRISSIFGRYRTAQTTDSAMMAALSDGKLYELFVLSQTLRLLNSRGFGLRFVGSPAPAGTAGALHSTLKFKGGPGMIKSTDSHFELLSPGTGVLRYRLFLNIEFDTLSHSRVSLLRRGGLTDDSRRHELDIIVTTATSGYPKHSEIAFGVECKAEAHFGKDIVKETLGVRREMCLLPPKPLRTLLSREGTAIRHYVPANPASEFFLVAVDPKVKNYKAGPAVFGIGLINLVP
ncbi:hypothetical protein [Sphingobium yanoikuyae]|uniref:hypothetical protein n=1 Tax=Sphingobium yanoikuyae TaxID=13690 RepID=UPI0028988D82|nr:hypothetical protein [Sphingobium yanoikuyae]